MAGTYSPYRQSPCGGNGGFDISMDEDYGSKKTWHEFPQEHSIDPLHTAWMLAKKIVNNTSMYTLTDSVQ